MAKQAVRAASEPVSAEVAKPRDGQATAQLADVDHEDRLRLITDALPGLVAYVDAAQHYRFNNRAYEEWYSIPRAEMEDRHIRDLIGDEGYATIRPYLERALAGERVSYLTEVHLRDAGDRRIEATYVPDIAADGAVRGFVALVHDVTERERHLEAERLAAERTADRAARLQSITAALSAALDPPEVAEVIVDQVRAMLGANLGVVAVLTEDGSEFQSLRLVGYPPEVAHDPRRLPVAAPSMIGEAVRQREAIFVESWAERIERFPHFGDANAVGGNGAGTALPLIFEGRPIGAVGFGFPADRPFTADERDLLRTIAGLCAQALERSRLHAAEAQARAQVEAAIQLRDTFLATASHDLKTPITIIRGRAQHAANQARRLDSPLGKRIADAMAIIEATADAMQEQIGELLDLSLLRVGQELQLDLQPLDLVAWVQDEAERCRQTHGRDIAVSADTPSLRVQADRVRLRRVLLNLVGNAVKYSPDGSDIAIAISSEWSSEGPSWALLSIRDEGIGIPANDLPHIFERFHRATNTTGRVAGTGIGLSGARQIVEQHGGTIAVESIEGEGSIFIVRMPCAERGESA